MAVAVRCRAVAQRFGPHTILEGVDWSILAGSVAGLLGASGAGKTTLLRILAGLDRPTAGSVEFQPAAEDPPTQPLRIGMVFQNLALWPHMTAWEHLACVLGSLKSAQRRSQIEAAFAHTRFPPEAWHRRPSQLSGGESHRLALARALAPHPHLLLLDEPLAQVDGPLRAELMALLAEVVRTRRTTVVHVTHHWSEAAALCDSVAVLHKGRMRVEGPPQWVYWHPPDPATARLSGDVVEVPLAVLSAGLVRAVAPAAIALCRADQSLVVRPQQVGLAPAESGPWNVLSCTPRNGAVRRPHPCRFPPGIALLKPASPRRARRGLAHPSSAAVRRGLATG